MSELLNVKQLARSKQKHSFNKDKQHSRRGRGRGGAERGGGEAGRGRGGAGRGGGIAPSGDDEDSDEDSDEEEKEDTSKFRKRPVMAQDRQFELNEQVDDDEIPKLDIESLLARPIMEVADAHFRFTDENEWDYSGGAPHSLLVIDCAKIAQKMKALTISQRLDLDLSRFGEAPLVEIDPLNVHASLKYITIHPELSTSLPSSTQQKTTTPEDSFLDDLLNSKPSSSTPTSIPTPATHASVTASSPSSVHASEPASIPTSEPVPHTPPIVTSEDKKEKQIGDATKASVEDLEDWLDSVI